MSRQNKKIMPSAELMYVKCASCGKWLDVKPGPMAGVTHGICPACYQRELRQLKADAPGSPTEPTR